MSTFYSNFEYEYVNAKEISLKGNVYEILVDWDVIDKSDILNIRRYLMVKNNLK